MTKESIVQALKSEEEKSSKVLIIFEENMEHVADIVMKLVGTCQVCEHSEERAGDTRVLFCYRHDNHQLLNHYCKYYKAKQ